jgi:hypothetical protein
MSSHVYTWIGALVCGAFSAFCIYRVWRALMRGESTVDFNYLLAWISGRDPDLAPQGGTIEFSRAEFPLVYWAVVAFWGVLGLLTALITVAILRAGIH